MAHLEETVGEKPILWLTADEHQQIDEAQNKMMDLHYRQGVASEECDRQYEKLFTRIVGRQLRETIRDREWTARVIQSSSGF